MITDIDVVVAVLLLAYLLWLHGPNKDGPWTRPVRRVDRQARRVLKMMRKALPALIVGAVFGLVAAGSDVRAATFAGVLAWVGGSVFVDTMSRPFGNRPRLDSILLGLGIAVVGVAALL